MLSRYAENPVWIDNGRRIALNSFPFLTVDFVDRAAVGAGDKISFPKAEQGQKKESELTVNAGYHRCLLPEGTTGEISADTEPKIGGSACNPDDKKHLPSPPRALFYTIALFLSNDCR